MDTGTLGTLRTLKNILCTWDTQKHSEKKIWPSILRMDTWTLGTLRTLKNILWKKSDPLFWEWTLGHSGHSGLVNSWIQNFDVVRTIEGQSFNPGSNGSQNLWYPHYSVHFEIYQYHILKSRSMTSHFCLFFNLLPAFQTMCGGWLGGPSCSLLTLRNRWWLLSRPMEL